LIYHLSNVWLLQFSSLAKAFYPSWILSIQCQFQCWTLANQSTYGHISVDLNSRDLVNLWTKQQIHQQTDFSLLILILKIISSPEAEMIELIVAKIFFLSLFKLFQLLLSILKNCQLKRKPKFIFWTKNINFVFF
jgi:hypothetical protein